MFLEDHGLWMVTTLVQITGHADLISFSLNSLICLAGKIISSWKTYSAN